MMVKVGEIDDTYFQMRAGVDEDSFKELLDSVLRDGVLVPILLHVSDAGYSVVAGHRRLAAARLAGHTDIPGYVVEKKETSGWSGAFAENLFRKDLSAIELAAAVCDCIKAGTYTEETLARALGRSRQWIRFYTEVASWPDDLSLAVHLGRLSVSAAHHLAEISDAVHRAMLVQYACENGATARVTAAWLQAWKAGQVSQDPGGIPPAAGREGVPPIEPYTPCVICSRQQKMIDLHYTPVCDGCSGLLVDLARELASRGEIPGR